MGLPLIHIIHVLLETREWILAISSFIWAKASISEKFVCFAFKVVWEVT